MLFSCETLSRSPQEETVAHFHVPPFQSINCQSGVIVSIKQQISDSRHFEIRDSQLCIPYKYSNSWLVGLQVNE